MRPGYCLLPIFAALAGCAAQPPAFAQRLDPRAADYAGLRVFVDMPDGAVAAAGSPRLGLRVRWDDETDLSEEVPLLAVSDPRAQPGQTAYGISPADAASLRRLGDRIEASETGGSAEVRIVLEACPSGDASPDLSGVEIALAAPSDRRPLPLPTTPDRPIRVQRAAPALCP